MRRLAPLLLLSLAALTAWLSACTAAGELVLTPTVPTSSQPLQLVWEGGDEDALATPIWTVDGVDRTDLTGLWLVPAEQTLRGQVWSARLDEPAIVSATVTIGNSPPSITDAWLGPDEADATTPIIGSADGWFDADGDTPGFRVTWTVDDVEVEGSGLRLDPGPYARGAIVQATVVPFDGQAEGTPIVASVTIGNAAPDAPTVAIDPATPFVGETDLQCLVTDTSDPDGDPVSIEITWAVDGMHYPDEGGPWLGPQTTDQAGDTVPVGDLAANQNWTCRAALRDPDDALGEASEATVLVVVGPVDDLAPIDVNPTSPRSGEAVSPRDYLEKVSGWYFGHAT